MRYAVLAICLFAAGAWLLEYSYRVDVAPVPVLKIDRAGYAEQTQYGKPVLERLKPTVRNVTPQQMTQFAGAGQSIVLRLPPLQPPPLPPRPAKPLLLARPVVVSAGILRSGETDVQLAGIAALPAEAKCSGAGVNWWPCGAFARNAMRQLIRQRTVSCQVLPRLQTRQQTGDGTNKLRAAVCSLPGHDLARWLVRQGWAVPEPAGSYAADLAAAKRAGEGQWGQGPPR